MVSPVKKQTMMKPSTASYAISTSSSTTGGATVQRRPVSSVEDYRKAREMFGDMLSVKQEASSVQARRRPIFLKTNSNNPILIPLPPSHSRSTQTLQSVPV